MGVFDLPRGKPEDKRIKVIADFLTRVVYHEEEIKSALEWAELQPGIYSLKQPRLAWLAAVTDACNGGRLEALVDAAAGVKQDAFLKQELARELEQMPAAGDGRWYRCIDPWDSKLVGPDASRAVIDRSGLRNGLRQLAREQRRVLVISGSAGSGKSHSLRLIEHLWDAKHLVGHRYALVSTHESSGEWTGDQLALTLARRLGLDLDIRPGGDELGDALVRKILDLIVGRYPQDQASPCWIVLDGLDRPLVHESARDMARRLIAMVGLGALRPTRLIITGLDDLTNEERRYAIWERIPAIDNVLMREFISAVAGEVGYQLRQGELDAHVADVLGSGAERRTLDEVEDAVIRLVHGELAGSHDGG